jgi:hypothetical protein
VRALLPAAAALVLLAAPAAASAPTTAPGADFDGDGHADLAIGAPSDSVEGFDAAGAVNVLYGGAGGLTARRDQQFTQASHGVLDAPETGDRFGATLAAGDFDGDAYDDLAVGVPGESVRAGGVDHTRAGMVQILHGGPHGLAGRGELWWTQDRTGVEGTLEGEDNFASALAAGDFDGDRRDDLAIGTPLDSVSGRRAAGAVNVLYGGPSGLSVAGDDLWTLDTPGVKGRADANFRFGWALAAADLSGNGRDDLAIGIPGGRISGHREAGAVTVLYGRSGGLSAVDDLWSQDARGITARAATSDQFGAALAIGDFDRDGFGDLAVGVPLENAGGAADAGAVNVLYGSSSGLSARGAQLWTQAVTGVKGDVATLDRFGAALVAGDVSRNGAAELAIGVPGEDTSGKRDAGAVNVLYGGPGGLRERGDQRWTQDNTGIKAHAEAGDLFGSTLGLGDFDADSALDLAVGAPHDTVAGYARAGAVNVIAGSMRRLRERGDELWTQATPGVRGAVGTDAFASSLAGP